MKYCKLQVDCGRHILDISRTYIPSTSMWYQDQTLRKVAATAGTRPDLNSIGLTMLTTEVLLSLGPSKTTMDSQRRAECLTKGMKRGAAVFVYHSSIYTYNYIYIYMNYIYALNY